MHIKHKWTYKTLHTTLFKKILKCLTWTFIYSVANTIALHFHVLIILFEFIQTMNSLSYWSFTSPSVVFFNVADPLTVFEVLALAGLGAFSLFSLSSVSSISSVLLFLSTFTLRSFCFPFTGVEKVSEGLLNSKGKIPTSPSKRFLATWRDLRPGHVTNFFSWRMSTLSASWLAWYGKIMHYRLFIDRHIRFSYK